MLTIKVTRQTSPVTTSIEEITTAHIDHTNGCMWYSPVGSRHSMRLDPDNACQAFVMNEAGKTVMSHNFVKREESGPKET